MSEDYNITSGGITQEQFLNMIKNKDETVRKKALDIFTEYSNKISKNQRKRGMEKWQLRLHLQEIQTAVKPHCSMH